MGAASPAKAVRDYKSVLKAALDARPSGTRQRLALALGVNRSFVSQIGNPAYKEPIPEQHISTIFDICHFSAAQRAEFLTAYDRAHPGQRQPFGLQTGMRLISVAVAETGDPERNADIDRTVREIARAISDLARKAVSA